MIRQKRTPWICHVRLGIPSTACECCESHQSSARPNPCLSQAPDGSHPQEFIHAQESFIQSYFDIVLMPVAPNEFHPQLFSDVVEIDATTVMTTMMMLWR